MENGQLWQIGKYENGKQTGEWKEYYENGQVKGIGIYESGKLKGEWKSYDEHGNLIRTDKH
jgi:antitoxin component YwqK of YwqJK toxin-antitoxin module